MKRTYHQGGAVTTVIVQVLVGTGLVLLIPLVAMQFTDQVQWGVEDFAAAGVLLFGAGLAFSLVLRKIGNRRNRLALIAVLSLALVYLWAELAVGIFTDWGN